MKEQTYVLGRSDKGYDAPMEWRVRLESAPVGTTDQGHLADMADHLVKTLQDGSSAEFVKRLQGDAPARLLDGLVGWTTDEALGITFACRGPSPDASIVDILDTHQVGDAIWAMTMALNRLRLGVGVVRMSVEPADD